MDVNVLIEEGFEGYIETAWLKWLAEKVLSVQGTDPKVELGLFIVGQERIHQLNLEYLGEDRPTDVLAFAMLPEQPEDNQTPFVTPPDGIEHLGEVIVSYPQAIIQAEEHGHSMKKEIAVLFIHGILHLLGYDHDTPEMERHMRAREAETLNNIRGELD